MDPSINVEDALDALLACADQQDSGGSSAREPSCSDSRETYEEAASPFAREPDDATAQQQQSSSTACTRTRKYTRAMFIAKAQAQPKRPVIDVQSPYNIVRTPETIVQYCSDYDIVNESAHKDLGFDNIVPTTFGLNGFITGISFMEDSLIKVITSDILQDPCIRAECNYGLVNSTRFDELVRTGSVSMRSYEKNARMRIKKKTRPGAKPRKVQGNGTCFNSSIMIWIYSSVTNCVYKIRVFRTGRIGLPGTRPDMIYDVIEKINQTLIPLMHALMCLDSSTYATSHDTSEEMHLVSLEPIMKDYKWLYILVDRQILDLHALDAIFDMYARNTEQDPRVSFHQHKDSTPKLALRLTSIATNESMRVSIFRSGKINILGAKCDMVFTKKVCDFIASIISTHPEIIVESNDTASD